MKNYLQRNKYSEVNIAVHEHGLHDEMKTSTEYRKRKHKITQDRTNRLKKLNSGNRESLQSKSSNRYEQAHNAEMRKWKG